MPCTLAPALATARDTDPIPKLPGTTGSVGSVGGNAFSIEVVFLAVHINTGNGYTSIQIKYTDTQDILKRNTHCCKVKMLQINDFRFI